MIYEDVPWWLYVEPPETPPLPWSGEVIPIDVPPVPVDVPIAGPVIHFIGEGEHAVWNDVWNWIKGGASAGASLIEHAEATIANAVLQAIESWVGTALQATGSLINDSFTYAENGLQAINFWTADAISTLFGDVAGITAGLTALEEVIAAIDNSVIPGVFAELEGLIEGVFGDLVGGIDLVKTWAIDNIYDPLSREIAGVEATIPVWAEGALTDAKAYADQLVHSEAAQRAAAIAGIAASVAAITAWVDDCGEPMCQVQGPNTDLGKLFKALHLAADLAIIAALMNMTESELVGFVQQFLNRTGNLIGDVEQFLAPGGETVTGLVASLAKDVV